MKNVLISWPAKEVAVTFLPYIWGVLKTATEQQEDLKDQFNFLDPIYERDTVENLLSHMKAKGLMFLLLVVIYGTLKLIIGLQKKLKDKTQTA